jgi:hypothetical protein
MSATALIVTRAGKAVLINNIVTILTPTKKNKGSLKMFPITCVLTSDGRKTVACTLYGMLGG